MRDSLRDQFEKENTETLVVGGMALSVTGSVVWLGASDEGISGVLGICVSVLGVAVLLATVVWGDGDEAS